MTLSPGWRKLTLAVHVVTSVGFIGAAAAFLVLALTGAMATDAGLIGAAYLGMRILTWAIVVPLAFASLLVGIVSSLGTPWGLFRHYWVIVKLVLTAIAVGVLMVQTATIDGLAARALTLGPDGMIGARWAMVAHAGGGIAVLLAATALSVWKPRGVTRATV